MHHFFAYMARMRHIMRWGLMRNTLPENDQEHALQAAMIAHALATLRNVRYGGTLDAQRVALLAIYHDAGEVITGDLATPVKHHNPLVHEAFGRMEAWRAACCWRCFPRTCGLPTLPLLVPDETEEAWRVVKAADRICAYLKCVERTRPATRNSARRARSPARYRRAGAPRGAGFHAGICAQLLAVPGRAERAGGKRCAQRGRKTMPKTAGTAQMTAVRAGE